MVKSLGLPTATTTRSALLVWNFRSLVLVCVTVTVASLWRSSRDRGFPTTGVLFTMTASAPRRGKPSCSRILTTAIGVQGTRSSFFRTNLP